MFTQSFPLDLKALVENPKMLQEFSDWFRQTLIDEIAHPFIVLKKIFTFDPSLWECKSKTLNVISAVFYGLLYYGSLFILFF